MIKWKTLCNKSCRSYFIESRTVDFVFFWFFYNFISILQVHCLMRPPWASGPKCKFFLHLGPVAHWMGDRHPVAHPFLKISLFGIYFWNFVFLKYKNEKSARADFGSLGRAVSGLMGLHFRVGFMGIAAMGSAASCNLF